MIVYFTALFLIAAGKALACYRKKAYGDLAAVLTVTAASAAVGALYYKIG